MRYRFGHLSLDLDTRELLCDSEPVDVEPRTFAVLAHLIRHRDRVVPKEELLDEVWGDRFVSESALASQIKLARSAVNDDGRTQAAIKTVHRVGYRFVAEVRTEDLHHGAPERLPAAPTPQAVPSTPTWHPLAGALVGRGQDLELLERRSVEHRLVTITGPAGVGKTTLAAHLLDRLATSAPVSTWMCALDDTRDPAAVGNVVLGAVGEGQQSDADPTESLLRALEHRHGFLILDNCEHVLEATQELVLDLLARCPELRVVATSRTSLGIVGECIHTLDPLAPDDAVACFAALVARAGSAVDTDDPALADLCRRLDCLPLALELAASHARVLSPTQMIELLGDRFLLLRDGGHPSGTRHRSLHSAIALSWEALSATDRKLLAHLTAFVGQFSLEDVAAVAMPGADPLDVVDGLGRLVRRSLVVSAPASAVRTRFRLLESVREFASHHLGDPTSLQQRHAEHFAALAESLDADLQTEDVDAALATMAAIWHNLRAAVGYASEIGDAHTARRIIRAAGGYADVFQVYEVLDWCEHADLDDALTEEGPDVEVAADAVAIEARMLAHGGRQVEGSARAAAAHARCETHATLLSLVWCAYYAGDLDFVVRSADRLLELSRSDQGFDRGFAEGFSAMAKAVRQEPESAPTTVSPSDAERGILGTQDCLTQGLRLCTTDPERAPALLEAVVESGVRNDYRLQLGAAASTLTQITLPDRPAEEAMRTLRRTLRLYLDRSMWMLISADTVMAAKLLADQGDVETASRLLGARAASGYAVGMSEVMRGQLAERLEGELGDRFAALAAQGATWRPPEAGAAAIAALDAVLEPHDAG